MTESELHELIKQAEREEWTELDLSGQGLRELPPEIGRLRRLQSLNLGYNRETRRRNYLDHLPDTLSKLRELQTLDISYNRASCRSGWANCAIYRR